MNRRYFKDKVMIITGASSGIGLASAKLFASCGAKLALAARSADKLRSLSEELSSETEVICVKTDVSVEADCRNLIEKTVERFGRIDILVNNAGLSMRAMFRDLDLSVIKTLMDHGVFMPDDTKIATGIDNLDPDNRMLNLLGELPFAPDVVYHSVIGNREEDGVPGGSDGIVPYLSSHLDGAASELVVKSGHSVQVNPLAIQELRRILIEHLRQYPELKVELPKFPVKVGNEDQNPR